MSANYRSTIRATIIFITSSTALDDTIPIPAASVVFIKGSILESTLAVTVLHTAKPVLIGQTIYFDAYPPLW